MAGELDGKVALVTGASRGLGAAVAIALAQAGAHLVLTARTQGGLEETDDAIRAAGGSATLLPVDLLEGETLDSIGPSLYRRFGRLDVLVHCAAMLDKTAKITDYSLAEWNEVLATNLTGAFLVSRAVLPPMIAAGGGSIVHIASMHGHVARAGRAAYGATKGALIMFAKTLAVDHADDGIRVNTISPGGVETRRTHFRYKDDPEGRRQTVARYPMLRYGQPVEIANTALFLASDASSFITGADIGVDGGFTTV